MQNTVVLTFHGVDAGQSEIIIALLESAGFDAFEERENQLIACIPESNYDEVVLHEILKSFSFEYQKEVSAPRNWNAEWEQQYQPVVIEDFAAIRADFHAPLSDVQYEIIITPKMSFGTGHHATTKLMMLTMKNMDFKEKTVFDFGTGTGVLAILASMLGASEIDAMDIDDWVVDNAKENLEKNKTDNVTACIGNVPLLDKQYDIILANINRHILLDNMSSMRSVLKPGGYILMSGFYEEDIPVLIFAANEAGLKKMHYDLLNNWTCLLLQL
ncbi:MAG: 50S ribosomal protein L11 methyltransferase, partial [Bacteroidota bacterium]